MRTPTGVFNALQVPGVSDISNQPQPTPAQGSAFTGTTTDPLLASGPQRGVVHICPTTYYFCNQQGQSLVSNHSMGWVVDISDGRLKIEGPPMDRMMPQDPVHGGSYMNLSIAAHPYPPIQTLCSVHNAEAVGGAGVIGPPVAYVYSLDILHIAPQDRANLLAIAEKIAESRDSRRSRRTR